MAKLIATYGQPKDPKAFEDYYFRVHVPLARKIPGLRKYDVSRGPIATPNGPSTAFLIATLYFDDFATIQAAFASPEGQATAADLENFATGGVDLTFFDTREV